MTFYLPPGLMHVAVEPTAITTILGSCVAVCLWDAAAGIGGMNHYLLPNSESPLHGNPRYGPFAIHALIDALGCSGARVSRLQAKVFGGATMLPLRTTNQIGTRNAALAFELLDAARIPVVAHDVAGGRGRKVIFHTDDGSALMKLV